MDRLKSYCAKHGYEVKPNHGGGIIIFAPFEKYDQIARYIGKLQGVLYDPLRSWSNHDYTLRMMQVFPA